jgi:hypothetical protein
LALDRWKGNADLGMQANQRGWQKGKRREGGLTPLLHEEEEIIEELASFGLI